MTILDALRDPDLLGRLPRFKSLATWKAWVTFLKALFALPMDDHEGELYRRSTGRLEAPTQEAEETAAVVGRRGGKSQVAALIACYLAFFRDWRKSLASGERCHVVIVAQNQRAARVPLGYVRGILRGVPAFAREIQAERSDEIDLANGVTVGVWPSTYKSTRGLTIGAAICDEVDFWWQESVNAAEEVIAAIRPAMASMSGSKLILISSPYTPTGFLHKFYRDHWGRDDGALVWKAPSVVMNPTLDEDKIQATIAGDPERGKAEWLAEWRQGVSSFLDPELIDEAVRRDPLTLPPRPDLHYAAGCDPSGGGQDEFAWAVAHREGEKVVIDLVNARGRRGKRAFDLDEAVKACVEDLRAYDVREVTGDKYAGAWVAQAFQKEGIAYRYSERNKSDLYLDLLPLVTAGRLEMPEAPELTKQAKLLERRRGA